MRDNKLIGIITLQNGNNYGAMLQVYALSKYLESLGHHVFILDYDMTRDRSGIVNYLKHPFFLLQKIIYKKMLSVKFFLRQRQDHEGNQKEKLFDVVFDDFRKNHLNITNSIYNYQKLVNDCPKADVFICGSDQVWAADFFFSSPAFLLGFVPSHVKKISYAPSFGKNSLEPYLQKTFKNYVMKFDAVSVREKSGVDIVKNISGLNASQVLDPTLLLSKNDYSEIIDYSLVPNKSYIFVYKLAQDYKLSDWMSETIKSISKKENLSVFSVSTNCPWSSNEEKLYPTPGQLLGLIEKSSLSITNSFHGTVFSIILEKKFLSFPRDVFEDKQNLRLTDLLFSLKLDNLYCRPFLPVELIYKKLEYTFQYQDINDRLNEFRNISVDFLNNSLT